MAIQTHELEVSTKGDGEVIDLTGDVVRLLDQSGLRSGIATVFVVGSTAGITTTEFEPGLAQHDLKAAFHRIAPPDGHYMHELTWHDDNGHAHVCASLLGPGIVVPFVECRFKLGTWQQIVLLDFDTRSRKRVVVVQLIGE